MSLTSTKRTVLTQEVLRIFLRCSPKLPWASVKAHVERYMQRMQFSGYNTKFRSEIVLSACSAYRTMRDKDEEGVQPLYRPKTWRRVERQKERRMKKTNWFKNKGDMSVVFIPATPGSELKRRYEAAIQQCRVGIKVVETSGRTIKSVVQRSDPFKRARCVDKENCMMCKVEGNEGRCRKASVVYEIECGECKDIYVGETSRNAYTRGAEHKKSLDKKEKESVLHKHVVEKHRGRIPTFNMTVTSSHRTALDRQTTEAVRIASACSDKLLNSKQEFGHNKNWRFQLTAD